MHVGASGHTIKQYFNTEVIGKGLINSIHALELVGTFLGRSKEQLDAVDTSVPLNMAVQSFGGFLQYHVSSCGGTTVQGLQCQASHQQGLIWESSVMFQLVQAVSLM